MFETIEKAQRHLEPIDVINNEYVGYDGEGRLLNLSLTGDQKDPTYDRKIIITTAEVEPGHESDLREILAKNLLYLEIPKGWISRVSLGELVTKALEYKTE